MTSADEAVFDRIVADVFGGEIASNPRLHNPEKLHARPGVRHSREAPGQAEGKGDAFAKACGAAGLAATDGVAACAAAVRDALDSTRPGVLVFGPAGAGKSEVLKSVFEVAVSGPSSGSASPGFGPGGRLVRVRPSAVSRAELYGFLDENA